MEDEIIFIGKPVWDGQILSDVSLHSIFWKVHI